MTFTAKTAHGPQKVRGQEVPGSNGTLCVHRTIFSYAGETILSQVEWTISHVPTGCVLHGDFRNDKDAHEFAQLFLSACDRRFLRTKNPKVFVQRQQNAYTKART